MKTFVKGRVTMWKELKKKICRKINKWYYTDKRIVKLLSDGTHAHVNEYEDGIIVTFDCVECFDAEDLALFESEEKGSSEIGVLGVTMVFDANEIYIAYSVDAIKNDMFDLNPLTVWSDIMDVAKHEAFHARQYRYIIKRGGLEAVEKVRKYMQTTNYEDNLLELGAYTYQFYDKEQDFAELYDILCSEEPAESEGSGAVAASHFVETR